LPQTVLFQIESDYSFKNRSLQNRNPELKNDFSPKQNLSDYKTVSKALTTGLILIHKNLNIMKTKTTILLVLLVLLVNSGFKNESRNNVFSNDPSTIDVNAKFNLVKSDDNISIYTRWIPVTETRSTRQLKAEFVIDCPVEKVVSVLRDEKSYTKWMKATKTYYRLKTINENQWYSYVQFSIPWPLNNQDCILKYEVHECADPSKTEITLAGEPDFLQTYEGVERISHMEGSWVITQIGPGKSRVEYLVYSKQAPKFPTWITDPLIQKNLLKTMNAFRDIVKNS
jgi:hypothetical protein